MIDARGWSQLQVDAERHFAEVLRAVKVRSDRDAAATAISDATMTLVAMAALIGSAQHEFRERPVAAVAKDDKPTAAAMAHDRAAVEVSLMDVLDDEDRTPSCEEELLFDDLMTMHPAEGLAHLHEYLRTKQVLVLRSMINYIWHGARNPWEMMKRALAITRRYYKARIKGVTMTEVARLLDEKSRCAAVSARERDIHDELLVRWGVKAPKAADAGLKSPSTCAKNRERAMGNHNRAKAKLSAPMTGEHNTTTKPSIQLL